MSKFNVKNILPALLLVLAMLRFGTVAMGQTWSEIQPEANYWIASAVSSDGAIILAVQSNEATNAGLLKMSINGGVSWTNVGPTPNDTKNWQKVVMSSSGRYMMASQNSTGALNSGRIYRSSDSGTTWTETKPAGETEGDWQISISDNGMTALASNWSGRLYKTSDNGASWTELQPAGNSNQNWSVVAISGDGKTFLAGIFLTKNVFISHNAGTDWSTSPSVPNNTDWWSADFSYDGQIGYLARNYGGNPLKSTDGFASWSDVTAGNASVEHCTISCSSDGQTLALVTKTDAEIFYSVNGGATWDNHSIALSNPDIYYNGSAVSVSQDGRNILALTSDYLFDDMNYTSIPYGAIYKGSINLPESTPPSAGDGTADNPYQIATLANLCWLSITQAQWGNFKYFIQTADIDAAATRTWNPDGLGGYYGFSPIGTLNELTFQGTYDGNEKTISNLYVNRTALLYSGLFGSVDGAVNNLGVLNADITGGTYAGILTGFTNSTVNNCYTSGNVKGVSAGGLIGWLGNGSVEMCYSTASVQTTAYGAGSKAGGLIGEMTAATLQNCYAHGNVSGTTGNCIGGLIGQSQYNVIVKKSYAKGSVSLVGNSSYAGGFIGNGIYWIESPYVFEDCYWDTQTSGQAASSGGAGVVGKTTAEMLTQSTYTNWNFSYPWNMSVGNYPILDIFGPSYSGGNGTLTSPYQIANINDLQVLDIFPAHWSKHFIQTADIDAAGVALIPIGDSDNNFTGYYNGQNFTIDHFTYDGFLIMQAKIGFFKAVVGATLENIKLTNINLSAFYMIGGLAGTVANSVIDNCFVSGTVSTLLIGGGMVGASANNTFTRCGTDIALTGNSLYGEGINTHMGGFVGLVEGSSTFTDCYATGSVTGYAIGGFIGGLDINSTPLSGSNPIDPTMGFILTNCYAANALTVSAGGEKGGLYGQSGYTGSAILITNSFWDKDITGTTYGYIGGTSKTTAEMKTQGTFTGWDFATPIWSLKSTYNGGYPNLEGLTESVWTGNTSTDWNTAANWSLNAVPSAGDDAIIPNVTNDPLIATGVGASCNNLTVNDDASLTVQSGGSLITSGSVSGNISIQRTIEGSSSLDAYKYHLVSVPLAPSNASQASLFTGSYLYEYLPATNEWNGMGSTTTTGLDETVGYMIYYPNTSTTYTFTGVPNTGAFTPSVTYPGHADNLNFALVPNPYPSNIDWNAATGWTKTNIGTSIWFYNNGNYGVWNGTSGTNDASRYIGVGQAFFVQTTAADPALAMDNGVRTHTAATFLKSGNPLASQLRVRAEANTMSDELLVGFGETTSDAYSASEDALKLQGAATAPQLYTMADNTRLSINNLMAFNTGAAVPMNFETGFEGNVTLSFSQMESFPANLAIRLEDKLTHQFTDLRTQSTYTFAHQSANASDRFVLHFGSATGIDNNVVNNGHIWISEKAVNISSPASFGEKAMVEIFNTAGQCVYGKQITLSELTRVPVSLKGFAIVRVSTATKVWVAKGIF